MLKYVQSTVMAPSLFLSLRLSCFYGFMLIGNLFSFFFLLSMQEVETYFSEGLTKWRDLNLTEHFSMYSILHNYCNTFYMLTLC